jgi:hypothetical protein
VTAVWANTALESVKTRRKAKRPSPCHSERSEESRSAALSMTWPMEAGRDSSLRSE